MNSTLQAEALKSRILSMAAALKQNFSAHNAAILNDVCKDLHQLTGEVYVSGSFVKVA